MIKFRNITKEETKENNPNWPQILDHSYRIIITADSRCGKKIHYLIW